MKAADTLRRRVTFGVNIGAPFAEGMPDPRWLCDIVEEIEVFIENIERYRNAGVQHFVLRLACPAKQIPDQIRRIAEGVIPSFRTSG
jgi:hypothetical protein